MRRLIRRFRIAAVLLLAASVSEALGESIELVSRGASNETGTSSSTPVLSSADGRYIVIDSSAPNLVAGIDDTNGQGDVFLYDRVTGSKTLVSRALGSPTATPNNYSASRALSADGRWVAFESNATDVVAGVTDGNGGSSDAFLFDRDSGTTTLVSRASSGAATANSTSLPVSLSDDGRWLLFRSTASDLIGGVTDVNGVMDVFLYDRILGTTTLVSRALGAPNATPNFISEAVAISADGAWVLFYSQATNVVAGVTDSNGINSDAYLFERSTGATTLVSRSSGSASTTANAQSFPAAISANGDRVLFHSQATDVVAGVTDGNGSMDDTFLFERGSGTTTLVSRAAGSATATANRASFANALSADGRWVLMSSNATDLVNGVTDNNGNNGTDIFLFDRDSATTTLVTHAFDSATTTANNASSFSVFSADGRWVLVGSVASNLVGGVTDVFPNDVFLFDRDSGTFTLVSRALGSPTTSANSQSLRRSISADGRWVTFQTEATDILAGVTDTNAFTDAYLFDRDTETTTLLSRAVGTTTANNESLPGAFSADGRWVAFGSLASDVVGGVADASLTFDAFLFDRDTRSATLVSRAVGTADVTANGNSWPVAISADGRWVLNASAASDLVAGVTDANGTGDAYLYDRESGLSTLLSRAAGAPATTPNDSTDPIALSADGRWALARSNASNVVAGDANGATDAFLFDRDSGTTTLVSHAAGSPATTANGPSEARALSPDGRWALFESDATNLVAGVSDANATTDVFLFDRDSGAIVLATRAQGSATTTPNGTSQGRAISSDGRWVLIASLATNVVAGVVDNNAIWDVFLFDRVSGATTLVTRATGPGTSTAAGESNPVALSDDGRWVLFQSRAGNLVAGTDGNGAYDAFLFDRDTGTTTLVSHASGSATTAAGALSFPAALSADGGFVLFVSDATDVVAGVTDGNGEYDTFLFDRGAATTTLLSHAAGLPATTANAITTGISLSANGTNALLLSRATNLMAGIADGNATSDLYVVSITPDSVFADGFE